MEYIPCFSLIGTVSNSLEFFQDFNKLNVLKSLRFTKSWVNESHNCVLGQVLWISLGKYLPSAPRYGLCCSYRGRGFQDLGGTQGILGAFRAHLRGVSGTHYEAGSFTGVFTAPAAIV